MFLQTIPLVDSAWACVILAIFQRHRLNRCHSYWIPTHKAGSPRDKPELRSTLRSLSQSDQRKEIEQFDLQQQTTSPGDHAQPNVFRLAKMYCVSTNDTIENRAPHEMSTRLWLDQGSTACSVQTAKWKWSICFDLDMTQWDPASQDSIRVGLLFEPPCKSQERLVLMWQRYISSTLQWHSGREPSCDFHHVIARSDDFNKEQMF